LIRSRRNGITGAGLRLHCFFYEDDNLQSASVVHGVDIYNKEDSLLATYSKSGAGSSIRTRFDGIEELNFEVPDWPKGIYNDVWRFTEEGSTESSIKEFEIVIRGSQREQKDTLTLNSLNMVAGLATERFSLGEKKWIHLTIKDAAGNLKSPDNTRLIFKEYGVDSAFLYQESTISDGLNVYYSFNSSELRAIYPDDITRDKNYEWVIDLEYINESYRLPPVKFNFTEV